MTTYLRNPDIEFRKINDSTFLVNKNNDKVFYLNQSGSALWHILLEPASIGQLVETLECAFPDTPTELVAQDVKALVKSLLSKDLILVCR